MKDDKKKKQTPKKSIKRAAKPAAKKTTSAKKTAAKKSTAAKKITAKKPIAAKKTTKPVKKTVKKVNYPKHSDKDEIKVGKERPIIINGNAKASKRTSSAQPSKATVTQRSGHVSSITYHIKYD